MSISGRLEFGCDLALIPINPSQKKKSKMLLGGLIHVCVCVCVCTPCGWRATIARAPGSVLSIPQKGSARANNAVLCTEYCLCCVVSRLGMSNALLGGQSEGHQDHATREISSEPHEYTHTPSLSLPLFLGATDPDISSSLRNLARTLISQERRCVCAQRTWLADWLLASKNSHCKGPIRDRGRVYARWCVCESGGERVCGGQYGGGGGGGATETAVYVTEVVA